MAVDRNLADALASARPRLGDSRAVVLPDLFVDHIVPVADREALDAELDRLIRQGGGNLLTDDQALQLGGNAANTARALASLGIQATLVAETDAIGRALFEEATRDLPAAAHRLSTTDRASSTVALELAGEGVNAMLSDPGPLATLGPEDLDPGDWRAIEAADVVAVTNWAQMLEQGTEFVQEILERAHEAGALVFLDTGDPAHRGDEGAELVNAPAIRERLDVWGMNEHEASLLAAAASGRDERKLDVHEAARVLDEHVQARIVVHTSQQALSLQDGEICRAEAFDVEPRQRTGAGDAFNAGYLAGRRLDLAETDRLRLAHATAALAIADPPEPPTLAEVEAFLAEA